MKLTDKQKSFAADWKGETNKEIQWRNYFWEKQMIKVCPWNTQDNRSCHQQTRDDWAGVKEMTPYV